MTETTADLPKTAELEGAQLDYWVARARGWKVFENYPGQLEKGGIYIPAFSTDWSQGGPVIEHEQISLKRRERGLWSAWKEGVPSFPGMYQDGPTPLIAVMRAVVAFHCGAGSSGANKNAAEGSA